MYSEVDIGNNNICSTDPPPPLQTHPHTHTMREKRRYNGALRILAVFQGRASQLVGGGRGGGFPKPPSHPAAARRSSSAHLAQTHPN